MSTEAHERIKRLKRKIFWWDGLSLLLYMMPIVISRVPFWIGDIEGGFWSFISFIAGLSITAFMFNERAGHRLASIFFGGTDFLTRATFIAKKQAELKRTETLLKKEALEQERRERELALITELERDMRATGIFKAPTKEATP